MIELNVALRASETALRSVDDPGMVGRTLIAIDTALGTSVALGHEGRIIEACSNDAMRHVEVVGTLIERVLAEAGITAGSITGVVSGVGPGPFTGLRVGIAAAQAFALGIDAPLLPVISHEAVALAVCEDRAASRVRVVQDAKRRELFVTEYEVPVGESGIPHLAEAPHIVTREAFAPRNFDVWPERIPAAQLVRAARFRLETGAAFERAEALYLRQPDVAEPGRVKRVSS